ncbi:alpha/beta fold hydrolase [Streptomyces sp. NBC_01353]|uniref:alpha/beta fold hydrolase n=1 Tax=Streptomyces sp. NBC_01353 TaxID=2903835 RepID=UPI002E35CAB8|nr:alpha/beta hydrolase [Streptomyces sp. NBC_01353]
MRSIYRSPAAHDQVRDWCEKRLDAWPVPHTRSHVDTSAGATHVTTAGSTPAPGTPSIVLVPGTNMNTAVSLDTLESLSGVGQAIAVDVPGQPGLSTAVRPGRDRTARYGRWLSEVMDQVAPRGAVVVGHSLGGAIALACTSERITARVVVSPAGLIRLRVSPAVLGATLPWLLRPTVHRAERLLRHMAAPGTRPPHALADWMALVGTCRSSLAPPPLPRSALTAARTAPVFVIVGAGDTFLPASSLRRAAELLLGADLLVIGGAGHLVLDEAVDRVASVVSEALGAR